MFLVVHQAFHLDAAFIMLDNKGKILLQEKRFFFLVQLLYLHLRLKQNTFFHEKTYPILITINDLCFRFGAKHHTHLSFQQARCSTSR